MCTLDLAHVFVKAPVSGRQSTDYRSMLSRQSEISSFLWVVATLTFYLFQTVAYIKISKLWLGVLLISKYLPDFVYVGSNGMNSYVITGVHCGYFCSKASLGAP